MNELYPEQVNFRTRVRDFFYRREVPYGLAAVRILIPLALLLPSLPRWSMARELYSTDGAAAPLWFSYGYPDLLPIPSATVAVVFNTLLLLTLITTSIGWMSRVSAATACALFAYINLLDSISTMTKYSCIGTHVLLLLAVSNCGAVWSVDRWLARRRAAREGRKVELPRLPVWPQRLIQLMIGLVYFGAGITKVHTPEFATGEQLLSWLITEVNNPHPAGFALSEYPVLVVIGAYATLVWEFLFVFLAWRGRMRLPMLGLGAAFHLCTSLLLGLYIFPLICISIYFSWVDETDVRKLRLTMRRLRRRFNWRRPAVWSVPASFAPSPTAASAAFVAVTVLVCSAGLCLEHALDHYGLRRAEGCHKLVAMEPAEAARLLSKTEDIRDIDKIDGFTLGTATVSDYLINSREEFEPGETLIAEVSFTPPHEDTWVECNIHDAKGRIVERGGSAIMRSTFRGHFAFPIGAEYEPGAYEAVLICYGKEMLRRSFVVKGSRLRMAAN